MNVDDILRAVGQLYLENFQLREALALLQKEAQELRVSIAELQAQMTEGNG